jgi:hypothetical protein
MKKSNSFVHRSVAGSVAASILVSSCTPGYNFDDSYYGPFADDLNRGESLFNLNESNLSEDFLYKLKAIHKIIEIVVSNKGEVKRFAKNPDEYLASKEDLHNVKLSESERRLLFAFADDDIVRAVKTNDIKAFMSLSSERGYIGIINEYNKPEDIRAMFKTEKDYETFKHHIEKVEGYNIVTRAVVGVPVAVVAGAVFYVGAAVIYGAVAGVTVGAAAGAYYYAATHHETAVTGPEAISVGMTVKEPVLRIWTDNNGLIGSDVFYAEIIDKQVNLFMELIEKEFPMSSSSSDEVRDILKIQLEGHYGLRK